ncbi:MAG: iron ABC transporter permease [Spirochaetaceae bacterium]|jgi:iron(III) transport system permease protein|nr:iron ABC transporter permease [Spirochaetaceae bacterium]
MPFITAGERFKEFKRLRNEPLLLALILAVIAFTCYFVVWPVWRLITIAEFSEYSVLLRTPRWIRALWNSLYMMVVSTVSCTVVAFIFAYTITRLDVPLKKLFRFIALLPVVSPPFIVALSYILLFGVQGLVTKKLLGLQTDIYGRFGLWIVQTVTFFPYAFSVIYGVISKISPNLEYAAYNMGASRLKVFKDVLWPLCRPGVAGGGLMAAIQVLTDFGNPIMIGGDLALLPTEAYMQVVGWYDMKTAAILAVLLLVPSFIIFIIQRFWVGKRSYVTITGKEVSLAPYPPHPLVKWGMFAFCLFISLFVLLVYGTLFYGSFAKTIGYDWSFTVANYSYVWEKINQIINSIRFSAISALCAAFLGMILAYIVHKKQVGINRFLDFLAVVPSAVPGMFLGLSYVIAFNTPPLKLTNTSFIMVLALMFWNLPTCYSASVAGIQQISNSVEDAALNLGADSFRSFRDVMLPLLRIPFISGFVLSFLRSVTCLSVIIFLYAPSTAVGTVAVLGLVSYGQWGAAAGFTVVLISIAFAVLYAADAVLKKLGASLNLL